MVNRHRDTPLHRALARVVPPIWRWSLSTGDDGRQDSQLTLKPPSGPSTILAVQVKRRLLPAELSASLSRYKEGKWLLAAPTLGPRAREILDKAGISWLELDGSDCRIDAGTLYIERLVKRERRPLKPDASGRRYVADLFSGKALRIVRQLLIGPDRYWTLRDMAHAAGVTQGFVSRTFATLEREAYLARDRKANRLADGDGLIDAWAAAPAPIEERYERASINAGVLSSLGGPGLPSGPVTETDYAVTAEVAAEQIAPFASWRQLEIYVNDVESWDQRLMLEPVPRGGNVMLIRSSDPWVFDGAFRSQGMVLASRPQVFVDLKRRGGAAAETAEFLRERGELWPK